VPLEVLRAPITPLGLHYILVHYDVPLVDPAGWRLVVDGHVRRPLTLTLDELRRRAAVTLAVTLECAGDGRARLSPRPKSQPWLLGAVGTAAWTGTPLRRLLHEAGPLEDAVEVLFTGLDRGIEGGIDQYYQRSLPMAQALSDQVLLAHGMDGQPLLPEHGFPLRLVVPGWYGMTSVKWLTRITVLSEPFTGYQQTHVYRFQRSPGDPGTPVTRMLPRSLMVPPGIPEFLSRERFVPLQPIRLVGRAWSGWGPIRRVQVSDDGRRTWGDATLTDAPSPVAWRGWTFDWAPSRPATYELSCRATDASGREQPLEPVWNVGGYANNAVQRVTVTVTRQGHP